MANECVGQIKCCRLRFAKLATTGAPAAGVNNMFVTKSLSQVTLNSVYTDGTETKDKNACDEVEVGFRSEDSFDRLDFEITLMRDDPRLVAALVNGGVLLDGTARGWSYPAIGTVDATNLWSIEGWTWRVHNGGLDPDYPYARHVGPMAKNIRIGNKTLASGTQLTVISGQLIENTNWGDGPTNDWPVASDRVWQQLPVTALPDVVCGPIALVAS